MGRFCVLLRSSDFQHYDRFDLRILSKPILETKKPAGQARGFFYANLPASYAGFFAILFHIINILTRTAESLLSPCGTVFLLIPAVPGAALAASLAAVDVHVLRVRVTLALPGPGAAPHVVVVALHVALVAGPRALGQHPTGVAVTLTQFGPCSTVSATPVGCCPSARWPATSAT